MPKFCCDKFQFLYSGEKSMGLNIRVIQFSKGFMERAQLEFDKSYLITEGYNDSILDCKKKVAIEFCPFCGSNLRSIYANKDFVQETV